VLKKDLEVFQEAIDKGFIIGDDHTGYKINPYFDMPKSLSFTDVALQQGKNACSSRLDTRIKSEVARGLYLECPLIAANMSSVVNAEFCLRLGQLGALGVMHRAWSSEEGYLKEIFKMSLSSSSNAPIAASIGAGPTQVKLATKLVENGASIIVIDIAQGYSPAVIETGRKVKELHPTIKLIVGNTVNPDMMYEVDDFADAVKVGIAQGSVCETKNTAGCTEKQFTAVQKFKDVSDHLGLPIISDGSIKEPADFTKAIAAGANSIMAGRIFARCPESAADEVQTGDHTMKMYFGMASREAQRRWRGGLKKGTCPEGKTDLIPIGESVHSLLERYTGALRSGMTYVGATNIAEFQNMAKFVKV
jgi:IMP dehydrogenase